MNRIRLLDRQVSELIAAGEVVERPASAVKELLENSIDAGAKAVTAEIKNGGISFIRITDNGCGIAPEDVPTAFLRHATSKIAAAADLDSISTLGFRGEALASIAAVSKLEMLTKTAGAVAGVRISLRGGEIVSQGDAGCPEGTTIIIRDLFYNTPARMKFLKKDVTEANAVYAVVERIALSHPEISIRFIRDGREELHSPGDSRLISAIHSVLGRQFAGGLIPLEYTLSGIGVSGFITRPAASRASRSMQFFFINGRLVKSKTAIAALEEACKPVMMVSKYPGCVMFITMDCNLVDVNVHPAKTEVRFSNEKQVFDAVYYAVKSSLEQNTEKPETPLREARPQAAGDIATGAQLNFDMAARLAEKSHGAQTCEPDTVNNTVRPAYEPQQNINHAVVLPLHHEDAVPIFDDDAAVQKEAVPGSDEGNTATALSEQPAAESAPEAVRIVGECFKTYIIAQKGNELWLIDKHAAHERIIYDFLKSKGKASPQLLLSPVTLMLQPDDYGAVTGNLDVLSEAGFVIEDFGGTSVLIRAVPMGLPAGEAGSAVEEIAGSLLQNKKETITNKLDSIYHSVACRSAIKAGDKSSLMELESLCAKVTAPGGVRFCPHGRPVAFILSRKDLEKKFGRIQ